MMETIIKFSANVFVHKIVTLCKSKNILYRIEWHLIFVTKRMADENINSFVEVIILFFKHGMK